MQFPFVSELLLIFHTAFDIGAWYPYTAKFVFANI